ncbi:MAG: hypothetical protein QXO15_03355 [Nitrososphaerota archaeon]
MRISELTKYIVKHYFSENRKERRYGLLILGPPGVGKSMCVEEAGREIARHLNREFIKVVVRWSPRLRKFVINTEGEREIESVLAEENKYFIFTDFRLSTVEPSDLSGVPRSRDGITYYDPLLWAVLHSANPGILFLDELTWITREDVWSIVPQLVLDKIAGLTKFSEDTLVIAAGNRPEDSTLVRLIHAPLLNRFKIIKVSPATIDEWAQWMSKRYGDKWDKRVLAFLVRFKDEGYFLKMPEQPEGLEAWASPRTWTWLALDLFEGFDSLEDICGLVGEEIGRKFHAFLQLNVDIDELINNPKKFHELSFDAKYIVPIMLASWISQHQKSMAKAFPLIDEMSSRQHEFLVIACISMSKKTLVNFLKELFNYNTKYKEILSEIAINIKDQIAAD